MGRRRSAQDADLQALYDQVPDVGCKGLCHRACGPVAMSPREAARIRAAGVEIRDYTPELVQAHAINGVRCPALDANNRCAVYEIRPMVCRVWGVAESLRCGYGCVPEGGWISDVEAQALIAAAARAGGALADAARREAFVDQLRRNPERQRLLRDVIGREANRSEVDGGIVD